MSVIWMSFHKSGHYTTFAEITQVQRLLTSEYDSDHVLMLERLIPALHALLVFEDSRTWVAG